MHSTKNHHLGSQYKQILGKSCKHQAPLKMVTRLAIIIVLLILCNSSITQAAVNPSYVSLVNQFLAPHNAARAALGERPLVWDSRLARYAQWYAAQRRGDCALKHSNGPYGENIFWGSGNGWTPANAVADWVSEKKFYHYRFNSCNWGRECGHYTQIVWKSSTRVGCAKVMCYKGDIFITCNYDPPGNYIGERPY